MWLHLAQCSPGEPLIPARAPVVVQRSLTPLTPPPQPPAHPTAKAGKQQRDRLPSGSSTLLAAVVGGATGISLWGSGWRERETRSEHVIFDLREERAQCRFLPTSLGPPSWSHSSPREMTVRQEGKAWCRGQATLFSAGSCPSTWQRLEEGKAGLCPLCCLCAICSPQGRGQREGSLGPPSSSSTDSELRLTLTHGWGRCPWQGWHVRVLGGVFYMQRGACMLA